MRVFSVLTSVVLAVAAQAGPNLVVDQERLARDVSIDLRYIIPGDCELQAVDLCVGGPGARRVLKFSVFAQNVGDEDLVVGNPGDEQDVMLGDGTRKWVYSQCHGHWHFQTFARYELRRPGETTPFLTGQKRSFCIEDTEPSTGRRYGCTAELPVQGVQAGYGDLYPSNIACQWIDVTDGFPAGTYDLCVLINTAGFLPEPTEDDLTCTTVTIAEPTAPGPKAKLLAPRGRTRARVGRRLKVAWKKKVPGAFKFQELWYSTDGGATWQFIVGDLPPKRHSYAWSIPAEAASDQARVRLVVWNRNPPDGGPESFQRATSDSAPFKIRP